MHSSASGARSLLTRTVHIKITPTPASFAERREVLRVLERFGQVKMFRSLKYQKKPVPNAFLTLFSSETAVKELINASPVRYRLVSEPSSQTTTSAEVQSSTQLLADTSNPSKDELNGSQPNERLFELNISPSSFPHEEYISSPGGNPLHGPFTPMSPNRSSITASLRASLPSSLWRAGLADWETDGLKNQKGYDAASNMPWRLRETETKQREKALPIVMSGLKVLWERAEAENAKCNVQNVVDVRSVE